MCKFKLGMNANAFWQQLRCMSMFVHCVPSIVEDIFNNSAAYSQLGLKPEKRGVKNSSL